LDTSVAGKDLKTAKYNTSDTEELANDILLWLNLAVSSALIHSIGSLAILKDLPGKGIFILWAHLNPERWLCRSQRNLIPSERCLYTDMQAPHLGHLNFACAFGGTPGVN
jgi:hypothetical protein